MSVHGIQLKLPKITSDVKKFPCTNQKLEDETYNATVLSSDNTVSHKQNKKYYTAKQQFIHNTVCSV